MRPIRTFATIALALAVGCATTGQAPTPIARGSVGTTRACRAPTNAVTGNNATITVFDTSDTSDYSQKLLVNGGAERLVMSMFFDQAVTVNYQVKARGSSTWRTVNGGGAGTAVTASTFTAIDFRIMGFDNRIQVVTGGTGPTVAEIDICPTYDTPPSI